jgi:sporulation protein YlmC with PRC-barrel domain
MLKKLLITTAVSGLMISSAFAQSSMSPSSPNAASPSSSSSASDSSASKGSAGSATIISAQKPDQWLASKFKGTDVLGSDNAKVGDVSDILFTKDGKIDAYIVSVGGFLGVGSKEVALAPSSFQVVPGDDKSSDKLKVSLTKDQLKQAANFEPYNSSRTTTGAGSGMAPRNSDSSAK